MTDKEQISIEAKRLLDDPAFTRVIRALDRDTVEAILACDPADSAKLRATVERLRVIRSIPEELETASRSASKPTGMKAV